MALRVDSDSSSSEIKPHSDVRSLSKEPRRGLRAGSAGLLAGAGLALADASLRCIHVASHADMLGELRIPLLLAGCSVALGVRALRAKPDGVSSNSSSCRNNSDAGNSSSGRSTDGDSINVKSPYQKLHRLKQRIRGIADAEGHVDGDNDTSDQTDEAVLLKLQEAAISGAAMATQPLPLEAMVVLLGPQQTTRTAGRRHHTNPQSAGADMEISHKTDVIPPPTAPQSGFSSDSGVLASHPEALVTAAAAEGASAGSDAHEISRSAAPVSLLSRLRDADWGSLALSAALLSVGLLELLLSSPHSRGAATTTGRRSDSKGRNGIVRLLSLLSLQPTGALLVAGGCLACAGAVMD